MMASVLPLVVFVPGMSVNPCCCCCCCLAGLFSDKYDVDDDTVSGGLLPSLDDDMAVQWIGR